MLQSNNLEVAVYKLKAICTNKPFGCNDEIELGGLLDHLLECSFSEEKRVAKLCDEGTDVQNVASKQIIESIKATFSDLTICIQNSVSRDRQLSDENRKLSAEVEKLKKSNEMLSKKFAELKDQTERNKMDSSEQLDEAIKRIESNVGQQIQNVVERFSANGTQFEKKLENVDNAILDKNDAGNNNVDVVAKSVATSGNPIKDCLISRSSERHQPPNRSRFLWENGEGTSPGEAFSCIDPGQPITYGQLSCKPRGQGRGSRPGAQIRGVNKDFFSANNPGGCGNFGLWTGNEPQNMLFQRPLANVSRKKKLDVKNVCKQPSVMDLLI